MTATRRRGTAAAAGIALLVAALLLARRSGRARPIAALVSGSGVLPAGTRSRVQKLLLKRAYSLINVFLRRVDLGFLNYGYAPIDGAVESLDLPPDVEPDRYGIQLYDRVARARILEGLDVLEVGCGRGGGASFLFDRHRPATFVGVDLSESSIAHCTERYGRPGLRFVVGDAEHLPFADGSFDVVLNVESSHLLSGREPLSRRGRAGAPPGRRAALRGSSTHERRPARGRVRRRRTSAGCVSRSQRRV